MLQILLLIAPLFLIIFGSIFLEKLKIADPHWSGVLNKFALHIGFPALIFTSLAQTHLESEHIQLLLLNSAFILGVFLIAFIIGKTFHFKEKTFKTFFICLIFGNVAYLGIPVLIQIQGTKIAPIASLITATHLFWIFTIGIAVLEYFQSESTSVSKIIRKSVQNPLLLAVLTGIMVAIFKIPLPNVLLQALTMVGAASTPIVLIVIGLFIGKTNLGNIKDWLKIFGFSLIKLFILPGIFYLIIQFSFTESMEISTSLLQSAMPVAITPFALAQEYDLDEIFISRSIVLSTILSIVSIPLWMEIVRF